MMKAWREVIVPHADIRQGQFDESVFAADLSDVVAGRGPKEYRDAHAFFRQTYATAGLQQLMLAVLGRLTGTHPGEGVIQIQTPFGGGKTHSLIALYHAVRDPQATDHMAQDASPDLARTLESLKQMSPSPRVAVFVGTAADASSVTTPWGDIARQLGRYEVLQAHDTQWTAPGKERLHAMLGDEPALILMDELAEYLVKLNETRTSQMLAFLQELTETVKVAPRAVLVATLPASTPYGEAGERALNQLQRIFGRVESIYTPVEGEEVYEVIRRRLFECTPDRTEVARTADAYWQKYREMGEDLLSEAREPAYRERIARAYPFHPELIDLLYERWSTFSTFQRTRGVLRFLAEVVADLYRQRHSAPLIQPSHLDLANQRIRRELLKHIGNQYDAVISVDIAGDDARSAKVDQSMGSEYQRFRLAQGLATAIFFASFSGGERQGVPLPRLRLAVLEPEIPPAYIGDTLQRLQTELWYLHTENGVYRFLTDPNLNRILAEREASVAAANILNSIADALRRYAGPELQVTVFPSQSQDVPDTHQLRLAVLAPTQTRSAPDTEQTVRNLLERCGTTFRTYRNCVLVLVADDGEVQRLMTHMRRLLALRSISNDRTLMNSLSPENRQSVKTRLQDAEQGVLYTLMCTYRHLARLGDSGVQWLDLGLPTAGQHHSLFARVCRYLEDEEILLSRLHPRYLLERVLRHDEPEKAVSDIVEVFLRYTSYPMVSRADVVLEAVRQGVLEGLFAVRLGDRLVARSNVLLDDVRHAVLVREVPEAEATSVAEPEPVATSPGVDVPPEKVVATPPDSPPRPQRYRLRLRVPSDRYHDVLRGVLIPLHQHSQSVQVEMVIEAIAKEEGFDRGQIERTVRETLSQLGIQPEEERLD